MQVRGASAAVRRRTEPLYQSTAKEALSAAFSGAEDARAITVWGRLAVRQQELQMTTEVCASMAVCTCGCTQAWLKATIVRP